MARKTCIVKKLPIDSFQEPVHCVDARDEQGSSALHLPCHLQTDRQVPWVTTIQCVDERAMPRMSARVPPQTKESQDACMRTQQTSTRPPHPTVQKSLGCPREKHDGPNG